jgi:hypothetical protein
LFSLGMMYARRLSVYGVEKFPKRAGEDLLQI